MYDLTLIPIHTQLGQPLQSASGFIASGPPKRPARSRLDDLLIVSLITHGDDSVSSEVQAEWLSRLTQPFFKTSGSVTSALRALIETFNLTLLEKNLKLAKESKTTTGAINLAALHRRSLYLAQSGLTHAFTLTHEGLQHFQDPAGEDRGLGLSRTPAIRYFQADLGTGGYLFMTDSPPETWREDLLLADGFPSLESLRRRLLNQAPVDLRLDLVQIRPGEGHIQTLVPPLSRDTHPPGPVSVPPQEVFNTESAAAPEPGPESPGAAQQDTQEVHATTGAVGDSAPINENEGPGASVAAEGMDIPEERPSSEDKSEQDEPGPAAFTTSPPSREGSAPAATQEPPAAAPPVTKTSKQVWDESLKGMAAFFDWWHAAWRKIGGVFKGLAARFSPEGGQQSATLSRATLLWIAVLVPIFVTAIALGVYLSRGRSLQYDAWIGESQAAVQTALAAEDPALERSAWYEALNALKEAEEIRNTEEVASLRRQAQNALDLLDGALRLAYQPALLDTLSSEINLTEIISYGLDLYLFDEASGWVIHAMREDDLYEVNTDFLCAPGNYSGGALSAIVDMVSLPINNPYQAHILAIDELGNTAYCSPSQDPIVQALPGMGGGARPDLRIAYENNTLYVLSPSMNTILVYAATNGQFLDPPTNYFKGAAPQQIPDLASIVDLDVNGPELYLLQGDGSLVNCVYSGFPDNPVTCQNPVQYLDGRPGLEDQTLTLPDGNFTTVFYTPPPTPLVNILDATHGEIYRFTLRFRLYQRLRPEFGDYELGTSTATAFTLGEIEPLAFIAFGNQVFFAYVE